MSYALVLRSNQDERTVATAQPMAADVARHWLDQTFTEMGCEPVRASGKVLTRDKVLAIAQACGMKGLDDPEWARAFAAAALGALGKDLVVVNLDTGHLS